MKKRVLSLLMASAMIVGLTACGSSNEPQLPLPPTAVIPQPRLLTTAEVQQPEMYP